MQARRHLWVSAATSACTAAAKPSATCTLLRVPQLACSCHQPQQGKPVIIHGSSGAHGGEKNVKAATGESAAPIQAWVQRSSPSSAKQLIFHHVLPLQLSVTDYCYGATAAAAVCHLPRYSSCRAAPPLLCCTPGSG